MSFPVFWDTQRKGRAFWQRKEQCCNVEDTKQCCGWACYSGEWTQGHVLSCSFWHIWVWCLEVDCSLCFTPVCACTCVCGCACAWLALSEVLGKYLTFLRMASQEDCSGTEPSCPWNPLARHWALLQAFFLTLSHPLPYWIQYTLKLPGLQSVLGSSLWCTVVMMDICQVLEGTRRTAHHHAD